MAKAVKQKPDDQAKAFRKAARELGCDDNEKRFQEALRTITKKSKKNLSPRVQQSPSKKG